MSQVKHKLALYEIFTAAMASGQSLENLCDEILKTNITKADDDTEKFICLSDFTVTPVVVGRVTNKFSVVTQDIICGSFIKERYKEGEVTAEFNSYELMRAVRTLLRANQALASSTFPLGIARKTFLMEAPQEFVLFYDTNACIHTLLLEIHMQEDD